MDIVMKKMYLNFCVMLDKNKSKILIILSLVFKYDIYFNIIYFINYFY